MKNFAKLNELRKEATFEELFHGPLVGDDDNPVVSLGGYDLVKYPNKDHYYEDCIADFYHGNHDALANAEYICLAVNSIDKLLEQNEQLRLALAPFSSLATQIETQGKRGTWAASELDEFRHEYIIHDWIGRNNPRDLPDDLVVFGVQVEVPGGQSSCPITMGLLREIRKLFVKNDEKALDN